MNKYLEFVSDEDFLSCVEKVIDAYLMSIEFKTPLMVLEESKNTTAFTKK